MALAFSLKNDLMIALLLAIVHLGLSAGFATGMLGPGSAIQKIPVVNVITDPSNYLTISLIACVAMTIILALAVADVDQHKKEVTDLKSLELLAKEVTELRGTGLLPYEKESGVGETRNA